jgi:hypothetical protein
MLTSKSSTRFPDAQTINHQNLQKMEDEACVISYFFILDQKDLITMTKGPP